jgi:hypothetical protein
MWIFLSSYYFLFQVNKKSFLSFVPLKTFSSENKTDPVLYSSAVRGNSVLKF